MTEEEIMPTEEELEEVQDEMEENTAESMENSQVEGKEVYGLPEPEPMYNQHSFIATSINRELDTEKVTYLTESELGRPLFSVRFLLDMEDILKYYLDDLCVQYDVQNRLSDYFRKKIHNVSSSGMSNNGFIQNLNASKRLEITRKRIKNPIDNLKGGKNGK